MKQLIHAINTFVLVILLMVYLLSHLSPYQEGERVPLPQNGTWVNTVLYTMDHWRQKAARYCVEKKAFIVQTYEVELKVLAVGLLGLNVLSWAVSSMIPKKGRDKISLLVDGGTVSITVRALEDSLTRTLRVEDYVKDTKVIVRPEHSQIQVRAFLTLIENKNLHSIEEKILEKMRGHISAIFPINKPINYEVVIHKLRPSNIPIASSEEKTQVVPPPSQETEMVKQPQYPDKKS